MWEKCQSLSLEPLSNFAIGFSWRWWDWNWSCKLVVETAAAGEDHIFDEECGLWYRVFYGASRRRWLETWALITVTATTVQDSLDAGRQAGRRLFRRITWTKAFIVFCCQLQQYCWWWCSTFCLEEKYLLNWRWYEHIHNKRIWWTTFLGDEWYMTVRILSTLYLVWENCNTIRRQMEKNLSCMRDILGLGIAWSLIGAAREKIWTPGSMLMDMMLLNVDLFPLCFRAFRVCNTKLRW